MRLRKSIGVITFLSLVLLIGCSQKQPPTPATPQQSGQASPPTTNTPTATSSTTTQVGGATLYTANCAGCHGVTGGGASGPAINTDEWKNNTSKVQTIIKKGQGTMPAFAGKLDDTQIKAIGDFVASLKK